MGKAKRPFCYHPNFVPKGLSAPALGLYTCIKTLKYIAGPGVRLAFTGPLITWVKFIICFPMKYCDFSVKSKSILPLVVTSEIMIFIFTVSKNGLFMSSGLKVLAKGVKYSILVWNYGEDVNVPRWNCWRHLLRWHNAFSARSQTDYHWLRHFLCADFFHFIALNAIWPDFVGTQYYAH